MGGSAQNASKASDIHRFRYSKHCSSFNWRNIGHPSPHADRWPGYNTSRQSGLDQGRTPKACSVSAAGGRSEEHTSELQSLMRISYAVFCLNKQIQTL